MKPFPSHKTYAPWAGTVPGPRPSMVEKRLQYFWNAQRYHPIAPEPLIPAWDRSILLTNSAVVAFKRRFTSQNIPAPGIWLLQPCVRLHNLLLPIDQPSPLSLLLCFQMLGVLVQPDRSAPLAKDILGFLDTIFGVGSARLLLRVRSDDSELVRMWHQGTPRLAMEFDQREADYYEWTFGMKGLHAVGSTLAIAAPGTGPRDVGNVLQFLDDGDRTLGYGFGIGMETAVWARDGLHSIVQAAPIASFLPAGSALEERLADHAALVATLFQAGIRPGHGRERYLAKKAVKRLRQLLAAAGKEANRLEAPLRRYSLQVLGSDVFLDDLWALLARDGRGAPPPESRRDISLRCTEDFNPAGIQAYVLSHYAYSVSRVDLFDDYRGAPLLPGEKALGFRLSVHSCSSPSRLARQICGDVANVFHLHPRSA